MIFNIVDDNNFIPQLLQLPRYIFNFLENACIVIDNKFV